MRPVPSRHEDEATGERHLNGHLTPTLIAPDITSWVEERIKGISRKFLARRVERLTSRLETAFFLRRRHTNPLALRTPTPTQGRTSIRFDTVPFGVRSLRRDFGKNYKAFLIPFFEFESHNSGYSHWLGESKGYALNDIARTHLDTVWKDLGSTLPIDRKTRRPISSADFPHNGVVGRTRCQIHVPSVVPLSLERVEAAIAREAAAVDGGMLSGGAKRLAGLRQLYRVRQWVAHIDGIPNLYAHTSRRGRETTRLFGVGDCSLQRLPKQAREALYAGTGWWDYDFVRCHVTILHAMCRGLGIESPVLDNYVADRSEVDNGLADAVGIPVTKMKRVINAMLYGQTPAHNVRNPLYRDLGSDAVRALQDDLYYVWLYTELKAVRRAVIDHYSKNGVVENAVGQKYPIVYRDERTGQDRRSSPRKLMAHLLQGIEVLALNEACRDREDVIVLMHDGFISKNKRNCEDIQRKIGMAVERELGFGIEMTLKGEQK